MFTQKVREGVRPEVPMVDAASVLSASVAPSARSGDRQAALRAAQEVFEQSLRQSQRVLVWWCGQNR